MNWNVNLSQATMCHWKQRYGAPQLNEVEELKALREGKRPAGDLIVIEAGVG